MKKILVANRGEIALRIMRSIKEMGIATVAVYSEADRNSPHVKYADEAVCIGPPPSNESYLVIDKIVAACKDLGADGVHPGYGFLSENADFARRLEKESITLIGPSAKSMEIMDFIGEMERIVYSGTKLDLSYCLEDYLDEDQQEEMYNYFIESESDNIDLALEEFNGEYDEFELRLYRIKFLSEVAN